MAVSVEACSKSTDGNESSKIMADFNIDMDARENLGTKRQIQR